MGAPWQTAHFPGEALRPLAERLFAQLRELSHDGVGITRESFGARETAAQDLIAAAALEHGLAVERDRARNLVVSLPGQDPAAPFIATGSHLDSVPRGGNYDGAAGVVAGLLALIGLRRSDLAPPRSVTLLALRGEESCWFGRSWIGAHALFGLLGPRDLDRGRVDNGRTLRACLEDVGADVAAIERGEALLSPAQVGAFIEVHIEQGPVLDAGGLPLGIVTGIYGNLRHLGIVCHGTAAHAGATPRHLRNDAVVAVADLVMRLDRRWQEWLDAGKHLVVTHGMLGTDPREHAISRVPGEARISLEIRADQDATLHAFHALAREEARAVARERGVRFDFDEAIVNPAAPMDARWMAHLDALSARAGIPHLRMPSGAGHDAAVFAQVGVPTAMLFIRNANGSHNPHEAMTMDDFLSAARVLSDALVTPLQGADPDPRPDIAQPVRAQR